MLPGRWFDRLCPYAATSAPPVMHREHAAASSSSSSLPCILLASACLPPTHTALCLSPRWLRWRGAKPAVEITIILAVAYLSFYVGQSPAKVGGEAEQSRGRAAVVFLAVGRLHGRWGAAWAPRCAADSCTAGTAAVQSAAATYSSLDCAGFGRDFCGGVWPVGQLHSAAKLTISLLPADFCRVRA